MTGAGAASWGSGGRAGPRELILLVVAVAGVLCLFLGKAFTIDDPLFLWLGQQIQGDPVDFFGFTVNWYGSEMPMHEVTKNPPLTGYFIAMAAGALGWSEVALHLAFLLPAVGVIAGTYLLACRLCARPLEAALVGLLTPAFLVSSTNVMCDTMMLAFWCWALWCWITGLDRGRWPWLLAASALALLAGLTKYFGLALVPLLLLHGLVRRGRFGAWAVFPLVPIAGMVGYELATRALYGTGMLTEGALYATGFTAWRERGLAAQSLLGLAYAGGSLLPALFFAPLLWRRWTWAAGAALVGVFALASGGVGALLEVWAYDVESWSAWTSAQLGLLALGGLSLLGLALGDARRGRDPERWVLVAWVLGTFVFASFLNWTNSGRSNLPMAPALGILLVRRLERVGADGGAPAVGWRRCALAAGALAALLVTWADYRWANDVREAARSLGARWVEEGRGTFFAGHWGFQYYMEQGGATALNLAGASVETGQILIRPTNNAWSPAPAWRVATLVEERFVLGPPLATVFVQRGVSFYSSVYSVLPLAFGVSPVDGYQVWRAKADFELRGWDETGL